MARAIGAITWNTSLLHMMFQSSDNHIVVLGWSGCSLTGDNCYHLPWPGGTVAGLRYQPNILIWFMFPDQIFISHGMEQGAWWHKNIWDFRFSAIFAPWKTDWLKLTGSLDVVTNILAILSNWELEVCFHLLV